MNARPVLFCLCHVRNGGLFGFPFSYVFFVSFSFKIQKAKIRVYCTSILGQCMDFSFFLSGNVIVCIVSFSLLLTPILYKKFIYPYGMSSFSLF